MVGEASGKWSLNSPPAQAGAQNAIVAPISMVLQTYDLPRWVICRSCDNTGDDMSNTGSKFVVACLHFLFLMEEF